MDSSTDPLSPAERAFLAALQELGVPFLVVGMSAALMQGVRGSTEDIDLWFGMVGDPRIAEAARSAGGFFVSRMQPPLVGGCGDRFDIVTHMSGLPHFAAEYEASSVIDIGDIRLRVLPLERILVSKRAANREKDRLTIARIEETLRVIQRLRDD